MIVMGTAVLVSVEEYLHAVYRPDCDYVDGVVEERNLGEYDHGKLQGELIIYLGALRKRLGIHVVPEQRVRVKPTRYRIPDICVVVGAEPQEQVFTKPPFLCIEILSVEDRMVRVQERIDDYLEFGVRYVWVINPQTRKAWIYTSDGAREAKDGVLRTANPEIAVPLSEVLPER
jgi:Uma2 family endonuclease